MNSPVLKRELKTTSRSWRLMGMITFHCSLLALVLLSFIAISYFQSDSFGGIDISSFMGIYIALICLVIVTVALITPATTSASIAGEKQRRTFDLLVCTGLSGFDIAIGKLAAGLIKSIMILIVSFPMFALIGIYGGVTISRITLTFVFILNLAIYFGSIGLFLSSVVKKPVSATILAYVFIAITTFMIPTFVNIFYAVNMNNNSNPGLLQVFLYMSPLSGFISMIDYQLGTGTNFVNITNFANFPLRDFYINGAYNLLASVLLITGTARNVNPINKRDKKIKKVKKVKKNKG